MKISTRAGKMPASPIRKLVPYAEKAKKKGIKVYHLNIGQPDIPTPEVFFNRLRENLGDVVAYSHSAGTLELRRAFLKYYASYGIELAENEIIVTNGGSEAVIFAMAAIADPGDEIIVIEPFYANYKGFASLLDVKLVPVKAEVSRGYRLPDSKQFEDAITPKTKGILFSNPANPTGVVLTDEEIKRLIELAEKYDLFLISDEVYREFAFDGRNSISLLARYNNERVIMADSLSKRYSACGARIGLFATHNKEVYDAAMKFAQARLSPPTVAQLGAVGLLELGKEYTDKIKNEYQLRRDVVFEELSKIPGVILAKPEGAFYVSVALPVDDAERFVKWMLTDFNDHDETVMVAPLSGFYATEGIGKKEIRIAYVLEREKLKRACELLRMGIDIYNNL
ncbi:aspartate aminotransferase [Kosmotoga arenicorallina S304]|uniref:Aminotransferase n=1 Tax=Kosmotoga arenicorallina S304 TaxID=1453497 RepID=A0A176K2Y6_9BACT|nr:pyridoxal phosphate-dependent aminotransferase [Kosmotoga arenicorallina]OAA31313.1 aspartate aminotransferase [Kosmotoga arenicorallina S304]